MSEWIIFGIVGVLSGICASLGIGGGFVLLLYFTAFAAMPQREAQLLNLVFFLPIAVVSLVLHIRHRLIVFRAVWPCILGGISGVLLGVWLASSIGDGWLSKLFGGFILLIGLREFFGRSVPSSGYAKLGPKADGASHIKKE